MENYSIGWTFFFFSALLLIGLYFLLLLLSGLLNRAGFLGIWQTRLYRGLQLILRAYEPIALVILLVHFILVFPLGHGLIAAFFILLGFQPLRNYISGRIFLLANEMKEGQRIEINGRTGVVQEIKRLGILLQTPDGLSFVNYSSMLSGGFVLLKGEKVGGLHELHLTATESEEKNHHRQLNNRLFSCPYIDWAYQPEILPLDKKGQKYGLRVLVREEQHLNHLMRLIREWGYECDLMR